MFIFGFYFVVIFLKKIYSDLNLNCSADDTTYFDGADGRAHRDPDASLQFDNNGHVEDMEDEDEEEEEDDPEIELAIGELNDGFADAQAN